MKNLLLIGDAACSSGFGRATAGILDHLHKHHNVSVLGVNYHGDPHKYPYPIYPAHMPGGDPLGLNRLGTLLPRIQPDGIILQTNPWHVPHYAKAFHRHGFGNIPIVGIIAVEGKNCVGTQLNFLKRAIFWNEFSAQQAVNGGMKAPYGIVPLGVDLGVFSPGDREEARLKIGLPDVPPGSFIVGNVNRNQFRKRIDLSVMYFAEWIKSRGIRDAYLYLHLLPGSSVQIDVGQLAYYCGANERVILAEPRDILYGAPEEYVVASYRAFDVQMTTTLGEGWGLTTMEGMACGIPQIGGDYAALGEWAKDAAYLVPCPIEGVMPDVNTMIGGIPDKTEMLWALDALYESKDRRADYTTRGLACVTQPQYRWERVAERFAEEIELGFE